jgi:hypothetical protein
LWSVSSKDGPTLPGVWARASVAGPEAAQAPADAASSRRVTQMARTAAHLKQFAGSIADVRIEMPLLSSPADRRQLLAQRRRRQCC